MMPMEKLTMYMLTIPDVPDPDENDDDENKSKQPSESKAPKATGYINLFDLDQR